MQSPRSFFSWHSNSGGVANRVIVIAIAIGLILPLARGGAELLAQLAFSPTKAAQAPWTFFTYFIAYPSSAFFAVLAAGFWLWSLGGQLESELGAKSYTVFWFVMTAMSALFVSLGSLMFHDASMLATGFAPIAAMTVAWGARFPTAQLRLMFIFPITGRWLAAIAPLLAFFSTSAVLAPFAAIPCVFAWLFATNKLPFLRWPSSSTPFRRDVVTKHQEERFEMYKDDVLRRTKEREERERLKKLFESEDGKGG